MFMIANDRWQGRVKNKETKNGRTSSLARGGSHHLIEKRDEKRAIKMADLAKLRETAMRDHDALCLISPFGGALAIRQTGRMAIGVVANEASLSSLALSSLDTSLCGAEAPANHSASTACRSH